MYDTINLRLLNHGNNDYAKNILPYLEEVAEHYLQNQRTITGNVGRLYIEASKTELKIRGGSICKWYLGDNFQTMRKTDMKAAIEKLSDIIHVPIKKAEVTRIDIGQNFLMRFCPVVYLGYLGDLSRTQRLQQSNGLYYKTDRRILCFYDKIKESKYSQKIPPLYKDKNILRYEIRFCKNIAYQMGVNELRAEMLYNGRFYISLLNRWRDNYNNIQKIKKSSMGFSKVKTKRDLYKMGVATYIGIRGGTLKVIEDINELFYKGGITKAQAYDLKQAVKEAGEFNPDVVDGSDDVIEELSTKVNEAIKYYL